MIRKIPASPRWAYPKGMGIFGTKVSRNTTAVIAAAKVSSLADRRDSSNLKLLMLITPLASM
jgi:hypothetical protein